MSVQFNKSFAKKLGKQAGIMVITTVLTNAAMDFVVVPVAKKLREKAQDKKNKNQ